MPVLEGIVHDLLCEMTLIIRADAAKAKADKQKKAAKQERRA